MAYILVSNDDGVEAPGIKSLVEALRVLGDVVVVAPDGPRSGASCSITSTTPVAYRKAGSEDGAEWYACSGTPVDCIKMGLHAICKRRPDAVVSGINLGDNASVCTCYSGTMGAVVEGCIKGIPSVGFSLATLRPEADFSPCSKYITRVVEHVLAEGLPAHTYLNVNFPDTPDIRGLKACRMAMGNWANEWQRINCPRGGNYYWLTGEYLLEDENDGHDMEALKNGYASIVPQRLDLTDYDCLQRLEAVFG